MEKTKEQLLQEINVLSENINLKASLTAEISKLEAENVNLREELNNAPTEQTTYVDEAKEEVLDEAWEQDKKLNSKIDRLFISLTAFFAVVNVVLVFFMADKDAVAGRTQMVNMELFGNITAEEIVRMFPFLLVLAVVFQIAVFVCAIFIANNVTIRKK